MTREEDDALQERRICERSKLCNLCAFGWPDDTATAEDTAGVGVWAIMEEGEPGHRSRPGGVFARCCALALRRFHAKCDRLHQAEAARAVAPVVPEPEQPDGLLVRAKALTDSVIDSLYRLPDAPGRTLPDRRFQAKCDPTVFDLILAALRKERGLATPPEQDKAVAH